MFGSWNVDSLTHKSGEFAHKLMDRKPNVGLLQEKPVRSGDRSLDIGKVVSSYTAQK